MYLWQHTYIYAHILRLSCVCTPGSSLLSRTLSFSGFSMSFQYFELRTLSNHTFVVAAIEQADAFIYRAALLLCNAYESQ